MTDTKNFLFSNSYIKPISEHLYWYYPYCRRGYKQRAILNAAANGLIDRKLIATLKQIICAINLCLVREKLS